MSSTERLKFGLPVFWEGTNRFDCRDIYTFWDDFLDSSMSVLAELGRWKSTVIGGTVPLLLDGTDASQELAGGIVACEVPVSASKTSGLMVNGASFQIGPGHELYFEARFTMTNIDVSCFVGLSNVSDGGGGDDSPIAALANGIGFLTVAAVMATSVAKTSARIDTVTGITVTALTWYRVAFHYDGGTAITFYLAEGDEELHEVNQLHLTTVGHYIPNDIMLTPTIEAEQQAGGSSAGTAGTLYVDYILCQQARQRVED